MAVGFTGLRLDAAPVLAGLRDALKALRRGTGRRALLPEAPPSLAEMAQMLLSRRGEASGAILAHDLLVAFGAAEETEKLDFLLLLANSFGPDERSVDAAIDAFQMKRSTQTLEDIHSDTEPKRQELIRRLNLAPGGTASLVAMREVILRHLRDHPQLRPVDRDFRHLFGSWFNRGFLTLRRIDWTTPAHILEKIIRYEAVHAIDGWDDLRNRLEPDDRRCYAFFHPQLADEPLIFVEVALTREVPSAIAPLLDTTRRPIAIREANTAAFYSISNTQKGLAGISFGNFLIKQVVQELSRDVPGLETFVTLSPIPGFAAWLMAQKNAGASLLPQGAAKPLAGPDPSAGNPAMSSMPESVLAAAASIYLTQPDTGGRNIDPVARFHLGNGASVFRINVDADQSPKGIRQSHGVMVNYIYEADAIEANHEAFVERGSIAASPAVTELAAAFVAGPNTTY